MSIRRGLLCAFSIGILCGLAWGQTTQPVDKKFDDSWLGEIALEQLKQADDSGGYPELAKRMEAAILARLTCGHVDKLKSLNDMVFVLRACKYLPLTYEITSDGKFAKWLIEHHAVSRRLFRAVEDTKWPEKSLRILHELVQAEEKKVIEYPDLAVAFATSLPMRHYRAQLELASMLESFQWYTNPKAKFFRYDLKKMPYELSRYLAVTRLNVKERKWAAGRYRRSRKPARSYFDLKYDYGYYRGGRPKKVAKIPYTLPNLRRVGGVCIDQAYYAAEVCRALGIPATIVYGRAGFGGHHAWVACLKGQEAAWDSRIGRYESHLYYTGEVCEPAAGKRILDCELALIGSAVQLSLQRREEADAATVIARMVDKARDKIAQGDLSILEKLAQQYNQSLAKNSKDAKKQQARTGWIKAERKIDLALVEDLIAEAIERNLAHRPVWEFVIKLCRAKRLPTDHLNRFFDVLFTRTAKRYPDYSCRITMRIIPTVADADRRKKVYGRTMGIYDRRPDLQGRILIALGDDYQRQGKKKKALQAYEQAAARCANLAEIVLEASAHAEAMFIEAKRRDLAIRMYGRLFSKARKVKDTVFHQQTVHYQLGKRLAQLLMDDGKTAAAKRVLARIK